MTGDISISELETGLLGLGIHMDLSRLMSFRSQLDSNQDGRLTLQDLTSVIEQKMKTGPVAVPSATTPPAVPSRRVRSITYDAEGLIFFHIFFMIKV